MMPMTMTADARHPHAPRLLAWCGAFVLCLAGWLLPQSAWAQSCWINGAPQLNFGSVGPSSNTDAQATLNYTCQSGADPVYVRVCFFVGEGSPTGMAPRRMTNFNGAFMNYDMHSDAARTRLIGPLGSSHPVFSEATSVVGGYQRINEGVTVYGRVPSGQTLPAGAYQGHPASSVMRYSWHPWFTPSETDCRNAQPPLFGILGGAGEVPFSWVGVYANYENACRITLATDLDFGNAAALTANRDQTSAIQLQCPTGTAWRVGLDNGINAVGTTRRMASGTNRITYELYRNTGRTQRWGNTSGTEATGTGNNTLQSLTVYGRVPAQASVGGTYSDTITVTLTY